MFAEDLKPFFQPADFAVAALYKSMGAGAGVTINVIFDEPGLDAFEMSSTNPVVLAMASDVASIDKTDTLTIGATVFRIVESQPQDDGAIVRLQLGR